MDKAIVDPYVEVTLYIPDWPLVSEQKHKERGKEKVVSKDSHVLPVNDNNHSPPTPVLLPSAIGIASTPSRTVSSRTCVVKKNGFNPVWEQKLSIPFDCVGDMMDLIFVRFVVRQEDKDTEEPLAVYCASLGSLQLGTFIVPHLPLLCRF
jgi:phosphatidylinositol phospholipase C delta